MKYSLFVILCFTLCQSSHAQLVEILYIDSIPPEGVVLDKGWRFYPGDSISFSQSGFNDINWQKIIPEKDVMDLPQLSKEGKICWLRIHFVVEVNGGENLSMVIRQSGASEFYLNGKLIKKYGQVNSNPANIRAYNPNLKPTPFPVEKGTEQVLAIRYVLQPDVNYATHFGKFTGGLRIVINKSEKLIDDYIENISNGYSRAYFKTGLFFILAILFFTLFLFFNKLKANLYFSVFNIFLAISWWIFPILDFQHQVKSNFLLTNLILTLQTIGYLFKSTSVYHILEQKRTWPFYIVTIIGITAILSGIFIYGWGWLVFGFGFTNIVYFDIIRVAVIAVFNKKKGAWIIVAGGIIYLINWILFCLYFTGILSDIETTLAQFFFDIALISIPVAFAIFLGYDFGYTNKKLEQKLLENESLAAEKQNILAQQNITLERMVNERTAELNATINELKSTQSQLIQSEKMASLGELTAGIAHEIQNPLNFVNNFSEVNKDLLQEMNEEIAKGNFDEAKAIANDVIDNEEKINHHGKRADSIVKSMLQHSQKSTSQKELTDINVLCDEYLRLAYQGFKAKDQSFAVRFEFHPEPDLPKIAVVPQDIGRVVLNLINNAFYACMEKSKQNIEGYEPVVILSIKKNNGILEINISDNGPGISDTVKGKIFQPFFTTKPTGEGTGLGLSLAYDIVTKGLSGQITVFSEPNVATKFIVKIPISK